MKALPEVRSLVGLEGCFCEASILRVMGKETSKHRSDLTLQVKVRICSEFDRTIATGVGYEETVRQLSVAFKVSRASVRRVLVQRERWRSGL